MSMTDSVLPEHQQFTFINEHTWVTFDDSN